MGVFLTSKVIILAGAIKVSCFMAQPVNIRRVAGLFVTEKIQSRLFCKKYF